MNNQTVCTACGAPHPAPIEYLIIWIDIEGNVIDPANLDANYGTLQELADDRWRIFQMNAWTMAQKQSAVQGIMAGGVPAAAQLMMMCIVTLWREKKAGEEFGGLVWKNKPDEIKDESLIVT